MDNNNEENTKIPLEVLEEVEENHHEVASRTSTTSEPDRESHADLTNKVRKAIQNHTTELNIENHSIAHSQHTSHSHATQSHSVVTVIDNTLGRGGNFVNKQILSQNTSQATRDQENEMDDLKEVEEPKEEEKTGKTNTSNNRTDQNPKELSPIKAKLAATNTMRENPNRKNLTESKSTPESQQKKAENTKSGGEQMNNGDQQGQVVNFPSQRGDKNNNDNQKSGLKKTLSRMSSKQIMPVISGKNSLSKQNSRNNTHNSNNPNQQARRASVTQTKLHKINNCLRITLASLICVGLPLAVYVLDVVLTINVIDQEHYRHEALDFTVGFKKPILPMSDMFNVSFPNTKIDESILSLGIRQSRDILLSFAKEQQVFDIFEPKPLVPNEEMDSNEIFVVDEHGKAVLVKEENPPVILTPSVLEISEPMVDQNVTIDRRKRRDLDSHGLTPTVIEDLPEPTVNIVKKEDIKVEKPSAKDKPTIISIKRDGLPPKTKINITHTNQKLPPKNTVLSGKELLQDFLTPENIQKYIYFGNSSSENPKYCNDLKNYYKLQEWTDETFGIGWFEYEYGKVNIIQQVLFVCFVIIGFAMTIINIGFRADIFLKDEWTSSMILCFIPPVITTCLQVLLLSYADGKIGLRCFTCHLSPNCQDIKPMTLRAKWPGSIDWYFAFLISCAVKMFDVYVIAIITLKFICDKKEAVLRTILKLFSWLVVFPWILVTPILGIFVFVLFPSLQYDTYAEEDDGELGELGEFGELGAGAAGSIEYFENLPVIKLVMLVLFITGSCLLFCLIVFMPLICSAIMSKKPVMEEIIEDDF